MQTSSGAPTLFLTMDRRACGWACKRDTNGNKGQQARASGGNLNKRERGSKREQAGASGSKREQAGTNYLTNQPTN